jgi:hypothetical protein
MEGGLKEFLEKQKEIPTPCYVSLAQFDSRFENIYTERYVSDLPEYELKPRGSTALFDAVGRTIIQTGERLRAKPEEDRPNKVLLLIITDGQENSSDEFSRTKVREMIEHQKTKYNWEISFLGSAGLDDAVDTGISSGSMLSYQSTPDGVKHMWARVHVASSGMRCAENYLSGNYFDGSQSS